MRTITRIHLATMNKGEGKTESRRQNRRFESTNILPNYRRKIYVSKKSTKASQNVSMTEAETSSVLTCTGLGLYWYTRIHIHVLRWKIKNRPVDENTFSYNSLPTLKLSFSHEQGVKKIKWWIYMLLSKRN